LCGKRSSEVAARSFGSLQLRKDASHQKLVMASKYDSRDSAP